MLGFIGTGNMATAIIQGIAARGFAKAAGLAVYDKDSQKAQAVSLQYGAQLCLTAQELCEKCSAVVLCVKPNVLQSVIEEIKDSVRKNNPLIVSIAAGKSLSFYEECFGFGVRLVRVMPNINATVQEAISAYCPNALATPEDEEFARELCCSFGKAVKISENQFSVFSAIGGCSPAFVYMFIDSLARAGVQGGLSKGLALEIAAQAVFGSAKTVLESGEHPWALTDKVCSPGGTTIEGVLSLQKDGFEAAVVSAVKAAIEKDKNM